MVDGLLNLIESLIYILQRFEREGLDLTENDIRLIQKAKRILGYSTPETVEEGTGLMVSSQQKVDMDLYIDDLYLPNIRTDVKIYDEYGNVHVIHPVYWHKYETSKRLAKRIEIGDVIITFKGGNLDE